MENLFSYGTLQEEAIQLATFHRKLKGHPDILKEYSLTTIQIQDQHATSGSTLYKNIQFTGVSSDQVPGTVYKVTREELERADEYEAQADYKRAVVRLKSGTDAWVYSHP